MGSVRKIATKQPTEFKFTKENLKEIDAILKKYPESRKKSGVMPLLDLAQRQHDNWIPEVAMKEIATILGMPPIKVFEVATFYSMYNLSPVGKNYIQCCTTTPCWLRGSSDIVDFTKKHLGIEVGETTKDGKFTLVEVECLGACVNAPMVQINDDYYEDLTPEIMKDVLEDLASDTKREIGSQTGRVNSLSSAGATSLLKEAKKAKITIQDGDK